MEVRLQKFLADAGVASRRKSEEYILAGRVSVNGVVVTELGTKVNPDNDLITFDDKVLKTNDKYEYILLNKPVGYITSVTDPQNRPTVIELVKSKNRLYPVGRLDYNTSGLLILTNDGDFAYKLTHPKHEIEKTYIIRVKNIPDEEKLNELRNGTDIGPYTTSNATIEAISIYRETAKYKVVIHEGKNRQVRRMFEYAGCNILGLERVAIGNVKIDGLKIGEYRHLTSDEVNYLKNS